MSTSWAKVPFKLPSYPLEPQDVPERILAAYRDRFNGTLNGLAE